jgi:hypothetical protein
MARPALLVRNEPPELVLVVITVDDADPAGAAADGEVLLLVLLPLLLPLLLHAAAASSATASGAASLTGTGTRASNEALIVIIPLVRRWLFAAAAQFGPHVRTKYGLRRRRGLDCAT